MFVKQSFFVINRVLRERESVAKKQRDCADCPIESKGLSVHCISCPFRLGKKKRAGKKKAKRKK